MGSDQSAFVDMAASPHRSQRFADAMTFGIMNPGYDVSFLADGYDWVSLPSGCRLVDVGGSQGSVAIRLAEKFPNLGQIIVQDTPEAVAAGEKHLKEKAQSGRLQTNC